jgi:hypothetical protein
VLRAHPAKTRTATSQPEKILNRVRKAALAGLFRRSPNLGSYSAYLPRFRVDNGQSGSYPGEKFWDITSALAVLDFLGRPKTIVSNAVYPPCTSLWQIRCFWRF